MENMTYQQRQDKAKELLEVLGMWGMTTADMVNICSMMISKARKNNSRILPNSLKDSGMHAITAEEKYQRIFHQPVEKELN